MGKAPNVRYIVLQAMLNVETASKHCPSFDSITSHHAHASFVCHHLKTSSIVAHITYVELCRLPKSIY